jgi:ABC-type glycerol-3-phosphate transport system substrate-binding protein
MSNKHTTVQKYFMQGKAAMMVCGDWIESETETDYTPDLMMVRSPILSALGEKLGMTETQLRETVSAVDEGKTSVTGVEAADFKAVEDARSIVFTLANTQIAVIPCTSVNTDIAKDILRFLYSKEGFDVFAKESGGARLPIIDYKLEESLVSTMTMFGKSVKDLAEGKTQYIYTGSNDPIRYRVGVAEFVRNEKPELSLAKKTNPLTAAEIIAAEKEIIYRNWDSYMNQVS